MSKKPNGFGKFDNLMRKLVKVRPDSVRVNRRGCDTATPESEAAIAEAAKKLAAKYRKRKKK